VQYENGKAGVMYFVCLERLEYEQTRKTNERFVEADIAKNEIQNKTLFLSKNKKQFSRAFVCIWVSKSTIFEGTLQLEVITVEGKVKEGQYSLNYPLSIAIDCCWPLLLTLKVSSDGTVEAHDRQTYSSASRQRE